MSRAMREAAAAIESIFVEAPGRVNVAAGPTSALDPDVADRFIREIPVPTQSARSTATPASILEATTDVESPEVEPL